MAPGARSELEYRVEQGGEHLLFRGQRLAPHPGLWDQKRRAGPHHPLLRALSPHGDCLRILDATAGLGQDALHIATFGHAVIATESEPVLGCLLKGFLQRAAATSEPWSEATRRIRVVLADHREALPLLPSHGLEVVFFDPMFPEARKAAPSYPLFRAWADPGPLTRDAVEQARRIARERVVVKVPPGSALGLSDGPTTGLGFNRRVASRAFDYWVIEKVVAPIWASPKVRRRPDAQPQPPAGP